MGGFFGVIRIFFILVGLTGIVYPILITVIAELVFHSSAEGSRLTVGEALVGSRLIAQSFEDKKHFWPRPSAVNYDPLPSGGSNLGPTSKKLKQLVEERRERLARDHEVNISEVPSELIYASGSGLDPHLTIQGALFQAERVAKARAKPRQEIENLIYAHAEGGIFQFFATPKVNVLELNIALDQ